MVLFRCSVLFLLATCVTGNSFGQLMPQTPMELGGDMALALKKVLASTVEDRPRIAVMPFANRAGLVTEQTVNSANILRGELTFALRQMFPDAEFPPVGQLRKDIAGLKNDSLAQLRRGVLQSGSADDISLLLKELRWDVLLLPAFDAVSGNQLAAENAQTVNTNITARFADGTENVTTLVAMPQIMDRLASPKPSGRFRVEMLVDGKPLPVTDQAAAETPYRSHVSNIRVPQNLLGRDFSVRVTNTGQPSVGYINENQTVEDNRIYAAAVFVNGLNTIAQPLSAADHDPARYGFVARHPLNAARHLLCKAAHKIQISPETGLALTKSDGLGDSVKTIEGFSAAGQVESFVIRKTGVTPASVAGVDRDAGVISVWFYAQKLPGDTKHWRADETVTPYHIRFAPKQSWHNTVDIHARPIEVRHITYFIESDSPASGAKFKEPSRKGTD